MKAEPIIYRIFALKTLNPKLNYLLRKEILTS